MTEINVCTWCGQRIKDVCSHPLCLRAMEAGYDTYQCMKDHETQKMRNLLNKAKSRAA